MDYTDPDGMLDFYERCLQLAGPLFTYHNGGATSGEKKISNKEKAYQQFPDFLHSKKTFLWRRLSNRGDVGKKDDLGGVGDATFECWIHKNLPDAGKAATTAARVARHQEELRSQQSSLLRTGLTISLMRIHLPVDTFPTAQALLEWVSGFRLLREGNFFSASAGYAMDLYEGYQHPGAKEKLEHILAEYPGFDFEPGIGDTMGRHFSIEQKQFVPQLKRINWLNIINEDGLALLGGDAGLIRSVGGSPSVFIHEPGKARIIQAGAAPAIGGGGKAPAAYYAAARILQPLLYVPHEKDTYSRIREEATEKWLYHFQSTPA